MLTKLVGYIDFGFRVQGPFTSNDPLLANHEHFATTKLEGCPALREVF